MILKGLLVVASGFIFIFSPGLPMKLISQFKPDYKKDSLYWGIGIWILAFFLGTFLQNLVRQIATGGQGTASTSATLSGLMPYLLGGVFTTLLMQIGMLLFLKNRANKGSDVISDGLALGFGIGLITQVFTGMSLIGAGAGLVFHSAGFGSASGSVQSEVVLSIANAGMFSLVASLLSMILYRVAILTISSVQGYLVAKSLQGKSFYFWSALIVNILFTLTILFLQLILGEENPGQLLGVTSTLTSIITTILYFAVAVIGYRWLSNELKSFKQIKSNKRSK